MGLWRESVKNQFAHIPLLPSNTLFLIELRMCQIAKKAALSFHAVVSTCLESLCLDWLANDGLTTIFLKLMFPVSMTLPDWVSSWLRFEFVKHCVFTHISFSHVVTSRLFVSFH
jgi:hypothetical protein